MTLLTIMLGIVKVDEGSILCDDKDITEMPMEKRCFNIVFQDYTMFPSLNAYENIACGLKNKKDISEEENQLMLSD